MFAPRFAAALAAGLLMTGCTAAAPEASFSGPWAPQLDEAYRTATADIQREVLRDGTITDAEYQELMTAFEQCVTGSGLTLTWEGTDGGFTIDGGDPDKEQPILDRCTHDTEGQVTMLYREMRRNPENRDERQIMAACLVRIGLVDRAYTAADYERDFDTEPKPAFFSDPAFGRCSSDPLGTNA